MNIIVAHCNNYGIGKDNNLPWHFKTDLRYFSKKTKGDGNNAILMGKNTLPCTGFLFRCLRFRWVLFPTAKFQILFLPT